MFKTTYFLPIALMMLIVAFYIGLPPLKSCLLDDGSGRRIGKKDWLIAGCICLVYGVAAFIGLGNTRSPVTFHCMGGESAVVSFEAEEDPTELMLFSGVSTGTYLIEFSADGEIYSQSVGFEQNTTEVLRWNQVTFHLPYTPKTARITVTDGSPYLGELVVLNSKGETIPISSTVPELCDEQSLVPQEMNFMNGSYFDEIYHARTAWEHLNGVYPYEISHPPLGKLIISLGILLFGMTPFGWRFSGTMLGVLMLPIMYVLTKKLYGSRRISACCTLIFAFDFMHFVQTRIATIDTYAVFFILLMYLFMYMFITEERRLYLALSGICFGLGFACKWTSAYAGGGLAVIWALYWIFNRKKGFRAFAKNSLFCIGFFVLIPAVIYYLSYIPYGQAVGLSGPGMLFSKRYFQEFWNNQTSMFNYHSHLVAEHPYSSVWYQWILDIRPILYYLHYFEDGTRSSFGAFASPLLCWAGLLALFVLLYAIIARRDKKALFIFIGYLAQLLPWVLVSRLTFEYHYFPCTVFLVLALGYVFNLMRLGTRKWKVYVYSFTALSLAMFALFYPALSGAIVDNAKATALLGWLPTWPF